jgi:hypothetical protein
VPAVGQVARCSTAARAPGGARSAEVDEQFFLDVSAFGPAGLMQASGTATISVEVLNQEIAQFKT